MLSGRKAIAHTSKKPGKTQMINYYLVNHQWHLVDLPGYGYAKTSKSTRKKWERMIQDYLMKRQNLMCAFILIDSNVPPQKIDLEFINWLGEMHLPFVITFTNSGCFAFGLATNTDWESIIISKGFSPGELSLIFRG